MKYFATKLFFTITVLPALAAGIFGCGARHALPRGTSINGVQVGGFSQEAAVARLREDIVSDLRPRRLTVWAEGEQFTFRYPQITFKDNAKEVVASIKRAGSYSFSADYSINGLDEVISGIYASVFRQMHEPEAYFNGGAGNPFSYEEGQDGVEPDTEKLRADILNALSQRRYGEEFGEVQLKVERIPRTVSQSQLAERTQLISAYTTYFDGENLQRSSNIALAGRKISGLRLDNGGVFSFNGTVGPRTKENGFKEAKIIEGGKFVYGVGGGVCQVSTTLYNAALLAGLKVTEFHPHSLAVGYVSPSRDAMVSGNYCDLKFSNNGDCPVYIRVLTGENYIRCEIYGKSSGTEYSLEPEYFTEEDGTIVSCCYIVKTRAGITTRKLLRRDRYKPAERKVEENAENAA